GGEHEVGGDVLDLLRHLEDEGPAEGPDAEDEGGRHHREGDGKAGEEQDQQEREEQQRGVLHHRDSRRSSRTITARSASAAACSVSIAKLTKKTARNGQIGGFHADCPVCSPDWKACNARSSSVAVTQTRNGISRKR